MRTAIGQITRRSGHRPGRRPGIRPARIPSPLVADHGWQGRRRVRLALCRRLPAGVAFLAHDGQQGTDAAVEHRQQPLSDRHGNLLQDGPRQYPQAAALAEPLVHLRAGGDLPPGPVGGADLRGADQLQQPYVSRWQEDPSPRRTAGLGRNLPPQFLDPRFTDHADFYRLAALPGRPATIVGSSSRSSPTWVRGCWKPGRASVR